MNHQHSAVDLSGAIVVGVGLDGAEAALTFAVDEARRTRARCTSSTSSTPGLAGRAASLTWGPTSLTSGDNLL